MLESIEKIKKAFDEALQEVKDSEGLEKLRISFLGKKGAITDSMKEIKNLDNEAKKEFGKEINILKDDIDEAIRNFADKLANARLEKMNPQEKGALLDEFTTASEQLEENNPEEKDKGSLRHKLFSAGRSILPWKARRVP